MLTKYRITGNSKQIGIICILWIICMFFYHLLIYFAADEIKPGKITFLQSVLSAFILGLLFGLITGLLEVFVFRKHFKRLKFGYTVILKTGLFIISFIAAVIAFILIQDYLVAPLGLIDTPGDNELSQFFGSKVFYKHGLFAVLVSFGINFFLQVDNKMGKNVLFNLFFGKFHRPRKVEKIIMFLDLTSSTAIAEKIGDYKYSSFLKEFFYDLDDIINRTKGTVYQYVGDEVVIIWDVKEGIENNNCLRCFFESQINIFQKKDDYIELYGVFPQFKAGIHLGEVIVTEVGSAKSEIAYHGDTINTAARLCTAAENYENGVLISSELLSFLKYIDKSYYVESAGLVKFKGKKNDIAVFSVHKKH